MSRYEHVYITCVYLSRFIILSYIKIFLVCPSVRDGCGRGRNKFAGRVQNHHVRF